jgi:hypothetical protein
MRRSALCHPTQRSMGLGMAYLRNFNHDIFVSYGHGPKPFRGHNGERRDMLSCWTRAFVDALAAQLDINLGIKDDERRAKIWMDPELEGNEPLSKNLEAKVRDSGLLLVVMSKFYLESRWCGQELNWFADHTGNDHGRIFVARAYNTPDDTWPDALRPGGNALLGYTFCTFGDPVSLGEPLGWPEPDTKDRDFWRQLTPLAEEVARQLRRLRHLEEQAPAQALATLPGRVGRSVFLGYMHDSLQDVRDDLRQRLDKAGLQVLPPKDDDPVDEAGLREMLDAYATKSSALVLVANEGCDLWPKKQVGGPLNFQLQYARDRKLPVRLWLKAADLDAVKNLSYRDFLAELKAKAHDDPGLSIEWNSAEAFVDDIGKRLDDGRKEGTGIEKFAVVCSNLRSGEPVYEDFQNLVLSSIQASDRFAIIPDEDRESGLILLADLADEIARADTLVVLCFDQDWRWANRIIQQLRPMIGNRGEKTRILVTGPQHRNRGRFITDFQTVMGVGRDNVIQAQTVRAEIDRALRPDLA